MDEVKELSEILDEWNEYHEDHEYSSKSYEDDSPSYENYIRVEENLCRLFTDLIDDYPLTDLEKTLLLSLWKIQMSMVFA